jgi:hypothetical protein
MKGWILRVNRIDGDLMCCTVPQMFRDGPNITVLKMFDVGEAAAHRANGIFSAYFRVHAAEKRRPFVEVNSDWTTWIF